MHSANPAVDGTTIMSSWALTQRNPDKRATGLIAVTIVHGLILLLVLNSKVNVIPVFPAPVPVQIRPPQEPPMPKPATPLKQSKPEPASEPRTFVPTPEVPPAMNSAPTEIYTSELPTEVFAPPEPPAIIASLQSADPRGFGSISNREACIAAFQESFPREARRSRQEGRVTLRAKIGPDGRVLGAEVIASHPRRVFDRAALAVLNSGICKFDVDTADYIWQAEILYRLQGESVD